MITVTASTAAAGREAFNPAPIMSTALMAGFSENDAYLHLPLSKLDRADPSPSLVSLDGKGDCLRHGQRLSCQRESPSLLKQCQGTIFY